MWHELVLCGIGGRTIAEAQTRLSYEEFCRWASYRALRGLLNPGLRIEDPCVQRLVAHPAHQCLGLGRS